MSWLAVIGWLALPSPPPSSPSLSLSLVSLHPLRSCQEDAMMSQASRPIPAEEGSGRGVALRDAEEEEEEDGGRPCQSRGAPALLP